MPARAGRASGDELVSAGAKEIKENITILQPPKLPLPLSFSARTAHYNLYRMRFFIRNSSSRARLRNWL